MAIEISIFYKYGTSGVWSQHLIYCIFLNMMEARQKTIPCCIPIIIVAVPFTRFSY